MTTSLKSKKKRWLKIAIIVMVAILVIGAGGIFGARKYYDENLKPVSADQTLIEVTIPSGATLPEISSLLKEKGVIRNKRIFESYVRSNGASQDIKAGTYELSPAYTVPETVSIITSGKIASSLITILPGMRLDQIKKLFLNSGYTEAEVTEAFNPALYKDHPALVDKPESASLEGYLYPESFQHTSETKASDIVTQSLDEMSKRLTPEIRSGFAAQNLSVYQGITLASIIDQEVGNVPDKATVAQVFHRRIREGRPLQSDVTAFYGALLDGQAPSVAYKSAYNTYFITGLPPTPISNVTEADLKAVVNPSATNYLYFVAGDDGKTYFSNTLEEHEALTKQYCHKLCGN